MAGVSTPGPAPAGKGRPTPKRSASSRRHTGPVAPPPRTRKEAAQRRRVEQTAGRTGKGGASSAGPRLLKRDLGPVRALVRDVVDVRRTLAALLLPLALLIVLAQLSTSRRLIDITFTIWVLGLFAVLLDSVVTGLTIMRRVRAEHPQEGRLGRHVGYGLMRATVFRRWRVPKPQVAPRPLRS